MSNNWEPVKPGVNTEAEFFEIVNDFGNPLELIREAISNSIDWGSSEIWISFSVKDIEGVQRLVIEIKDNGLGMTKETLSQDFWGLGFSQSRDNNELIGEKGHGTKIYLKSERVEVKTQSNDGAYEAICERPLSFLSQRKLHEPKVREIDKFLDNKETGTIITIIGYNDNERAGFKQAYVKDYILWFTKLGSIELEFEINKFKDFRLYLKCLDESEFEEIKFGHVFPKENSNIEKLFDKYETSAADYYVKKYLWKNDRLDNAPEITFSSVIYVEGDQIKRDYNPMIRDRVRSDSKAYRVSDRYGLWLCKDYIPIVRINEWITGFGSGSNAFVLLHGFINCQNLNLTANRGTIANTNPKITEELKQKVHNYINKIDNDLHKAGVYTLRTWEEERKTVDQEKTEFKRRIDNLKTRKIAKYKNILLVEPKNESELFGLFMIIYALKPDLFEFDILDYNTSRGIDLLARNTMDEYVTEGEHWYVELKYILKTDFNHTFGHIRWIICWDFDKNISDKSEFIGVEDTDKRKLVSELDDNKKNVYFLDNSKKKTAKIQVIKLREFLKENLKIEFTDAKNFN